MMRGAWLIAALGLGWSQLAAGGVGEQIRPLDKGDAGYHLELRVLDAAPTRRAHPSGLEICKVNARVEVVKAEEVAKVAGTRNEPVVPGQSIRMELPCWAYDGWESAPVGGGQRILYGGPRGGVVVDAWGSFVGKRFVVFEFVMRRALSAAVPRQD
ncbi:MAG: hypothetical protein K0U93_30590 [Gammaproteobacteria bacterium]|nr:hypothetical protein [Gammaproteobacteria bacterium]